MKWSNDEQYIDYEDERTRKFSCTPYAATNGRNADQISLIQMSNDIETLRNIIESAELGKIRNEINLLFTEFRRIDQIIYHLPPPNPPAEPYHRGPSSPLKI
jgi:hypothetical protein